MDTYTFTTASARADWLENRKAEIYIEVELGKQLRDMQDPDSPIWAQYDNRIDQLLVEADNIRPPEVEAWQDEAEAQAKDAADFAATEQSALGTLY